MVDSLFSLRHYTIVSTYDEYYYVGNTCTPRTHFCERLMAGSVEEYNLLAVLNNDIRANMLGDSSGFVSGDA